MFPYTPWTFIPLPSQSAEMQQFTVTPSSLQNKCRLQPKFHFHSKNFQCGNFMSHTGPWARTWHSRTTDFHLPSVTPNTWECCHLVHLLNHDPLCERAVEPPCKQWNKSLSDCFHSSYLLRNNRLGSDFEVSFFKSTHYFYFKNTIHHQSNLLRVTYTEQI